MTTNDKRSNYALKRYTSHNDMKLDFDMIRELYSSIFKRTYRSEESYDISGILESSLLLQVDYNNSTYSLYPQSLKCMNAIGRVISLNSTHTYNKPFENSIGYHYIVGANHCEIPNGVRNNPRSGAYEYDTYKNEVGTILTPSSIVDNGDGTITINVNNMFQSNVDFSNNYVKVWLVEPLSNNESIYIETCKVSYSAPNNTITTIGSLGQSIISTTVTDYYIATLGLEIRKVNDVGLISNPFSNEHVILGKIYSDTPGYVDIGFMNYLNYPKYHYVTNEISCDISGITASAWVANPFRITVCGSHDAHSNQHVVIASENINEEVREYISYNGYEFYDYTTPVWDSSEDIKFMFSYYDGSSANGYFVSGTNSKLYERTADGAGSTWVAWAGAPTSINWIGGGTNNKAGSGANFVFVDSTNSKIYSASTINGALTERHDFSSLGITGISCDIVYNNDDDNPLWMIICNYSTGSYMFRSTNGITWTSVNLGSSTGPYLYQGGVSSFGGPSGTFWEYCKNCLAYDSFKQRWIFITKGGELTGSTTPTIHYSEDDGDTWIEVVDAFKFAHFRDTSTKQTRYPISANYIGHRSIAVDNKGNVIVKIIKSRDADDMVKGAAMTFLSRDSGSNWEQTYPKQIYTTDTGSTDVDVWYDSVNGCFNSAQIGYDTENTVLSFYFTTSFNERFTKP